MQFKRIDQSYSTADGDDVQLAFNGGSLTMTFVDWREQPVKQVFDGVLAFAWQQETPPGTPRDDETYELLNSEALIREMSAAGIESIRATEYSHYRFCFNACGVLDVICKRV